jgi:hypothetical protein
MWMTETVDGRSLVKSGRRIRSDLFGSRQFSDCEPRNTAKFANIRDQHQTEAPGVCGNQQIIRTDQLTSHF